MPSYMYKIYNIKNYVFIKSCIFKNKIKIHYGNENSANAFLNIFSCKLLNETKLMDGFSKKCRMKIFISNFISKYNFIV
jgi:hypothetical protein